MYKRRLDEIKDKYKYNIQSCKGCRCCKVRYSYSYYYGYHLYCEKYQKYSYESNHLKELYQNLKKTCNCNKSHVSIGKIIKITIKDMIDAIFNICDDVTEAFKDIYYHRNEVGKNE